MRKILLAFMGFMAVGTFTIVAGANAMPIGPVAPVASTAEQVRLVCDEWGRCWRRPDYYRPYGYYGHGYDRPHYRYYGPRYYGSYGYGYGGWHRGWYGY